MEIISHRGYWKQAAEKNSMAAFVSSFESGFGTETDIRDFDGKLVISHDMPTVESPLVQDFFSAFNKHSKGAGYQLALNIKSDGLQKPLLDLLEAYRIENYFVFDMSVPDLKASIQNGLNVYSRLSEFESDLPFYQNVKGIWLDAFENTWYDSNIIRQHLDAGKKICIVSAELHKRDHIGHWKLLKKIGADSWGADILLCTDFPELAKSFFDHE